MRNINEDTITDAVLARLDGCADPRFKQVMTALVRHLHDFAREVRLTEAEWLEGIRFLTATGQKCDDKRQEFILLSDTLGLSMLTVAMNHPTSPQATEATVFGPFHVQGAPRYEADDDIANGAPGQPLFVQATLRGSDGRAIADAEVDVWQADADGLYDLQHEGAGEARARGILRSDAQGRVRFRTVLPVPYPVPTDGPVGDMLRASGRHAMRPAHVHFLIQAPGYQTLTTHVFRDGDPFLDGDAVFGVRSSLIGDFRQHEAGIAPDGSKQLGTYHTLDFDFVLELASHKS